MLQFRLRTLFIVTTVTALLAWILFVPPGWLGMVVLYVIYMLVPAATISGIVYHRGYRQAFFIGAAPLVAIVSWMVIVIFQPFSGMWPFGRFAGNFQDEYFILKAIATGFLFVIAASGFLAVGMRWWALSVKRSSDQA